MNIGEASGSAYSLEASPRPELRGPLGTLWEILYGLPTWAMWTLFWFVILTLAVGICVFLAWITD